METNIEVKRKIIKLDTFYLLPNPHSKITQQQLKLVMEFNDKVRRGIIKFETIPCLCGGTKFDLVANVDRYGMLQDTVLCTKCGLMLSNPRMTKEEYSAFYTSDFYRRCYGGENYIENYKAFYRPKLEVGQCLYNEVNEMKSIKASTTVLEFGAGAGWNLIPFVKAGANVVGMDYSPTLVGLWREYGVNMVQGGLSDIKDSYDIIILSHVLEHFLDPVESLKIIASHLATDGIIYIAVPNIMNFGMGHLQNAHTWYFSPRTLEYYCKLAGLQLLRSGSAEVVFIFGIFKIASNNINNDISELSGHYKEVLYVLKKAEIKAFIKRIIKRFLLYIHLDKITRVVYNRIFLKVK